MRIPIVPAAIPRTFNWIMSIAGRIVLLSGGWNFKGSIPHCTHFVAIIAPHSSNWDFFWCAAAKFALRMKVSWLGKHSIFIPPFSWFFRRMGGIPVVRSSCHGVVDASVYEFKRSTKLLLALSPEGTRKGPSVWKTGFYRIALGAGVPILPVGLDYGSREIIFFPIYHPCGNLDDDIKSLKSIFRHVKAKHARLEVD